MGSDTASRLLQKAANTLAEVKLAVDGIIGKHSIETANTLPPEQLYNAICIQRKQKYDDKKGFILTTYRRGIFMFFKGGAKIFIFYSGDSTKNDTFAASSIIKRR